MMKLQLGAAQQGGLYLLGGLLLSGVIYFTGILPTQEQVGQLGSRGQEQAQLLANVQALARQEDYPQYAQMQVEQLAYLEGRLPKQVQLEEQVRYYYAWAEEEGLTINKIQIPAKLPKGQDLRLQLQAQGPYYALVNFLQRLEHEGCYVSFDQLKLQRENQEQVLLSVQLFIPAREKTVLESRK